MNPITVFIVVALIVLGAVLEPIAGPAATLASLVVAAIVALSLKMARAWERFVILRAGRFMGVHGPGLFWIVPIWDQVTSVIDQRIQTTAFNAEQALTRDTVPVNVDAIVFWRVHDAEKAALEITDFRQAIDRVCQTSLRETIGGTMLTQLLSERRAADEQLRAEIATKITSWGVEVMSVEIRDVAIPVALQDAMTRQAQAERETPGAGHPGRGGRGGGGQVRRGGAHLRRRADGVPAAGHEHHLRDHQGARRHHPDADLDGRCDESGRHAGVGWSTAAVAVACARGIRRAADTPTRGAAAHVSRAKALGRRGAGPAERPARRPWLRRR